MPLPVLPLLALLAAAPPGAQQVIHVAPTGRAGAAGTAEEPLTLAAALARLRERLGAGELPDGGWELRLLGGRYPVPPAPIRLGPEYSGTADRPIVLRAAPGERVVFDGGLALPGAAFAPVTDPDERARLAPAAADRVLAATVTDPELAAALDRAGIAPLAVDDGMELPAVFPNQGYALLAPEPAVPEVSPPAVPPGAEGYGVRAGHPPWQEEGRPAGWLGSLAEPRGAWARFGARGVERAGSWAQWQAELERSPGKALLAGYLDANWLYKVQPIVAASAELEAIHLSQATAYGWGWRRTDKPCRVFGLLCEADQPGEWSWDAPARRLYLVPPPGFGPDSRVVLPARQGFLELAGVRHLRLIGLDVEHLGGGWAFRLEGEDCLLAGARIRACAAGGVLVGGRRNRVLSCDLVDLDRHLLLGGGRRGPGQLEDGDNEVVNCHIYQRDFGHRRVNVVVAGVGNRFAHNLVHSSIGQAVVVTGNAHLLELNEFFDIGYEEGDGGAVYSGADLVGYGNVYRWNFFHHLMGVPGKVERSGIHLDDAQAGAVCVGNVFFKSAGKGIFMNGGAGHTIVGNVFLEGFRGVYNDGAGGARRYRWEQEIAADPEHRYRRTKENYVGRAEQVVGPRGWLREPWLSRFPLMAQVLEDDGEFGRLWPIRCLVAGNLFHGNSQGDRTIWNRMPPAVLAKSVLVDDRTVTPADFVDYEGLDLRFRPDFPDPPPIPFAEIGLYCDEYRRQRPDPAAYRRALRRFFAGVPCMPGTTKRLDTARLLEAGPMLGPATAPR